MNGHYAVIGLPIKHSLSPLIHQQFAKQQGLIITYEALEVAQDFLETTITRCFCEATRGLNISSPYKELAYQLASTHTPRCRQAKAANTLWMQDGVLQADNTDGIGFIRDLSRYFDLNAKRVLLLGAGGAARGVICGLLSENISELAIFNRTATKAQALCDEFIKLTYCADINTVGPYDLIINATSVGLIDDMMHLPSSLLAPATYCYDLVYSLNQTTPFVRWARQQGCLARDGLGMLIEQAAESFYRWHGVMPDTRLKINKRGDTFSANIKNNQA